MPQSLFHLWIFGIDPLLSAELLVDPFSRCGLRS
jgi:hypothetical protein